MAKKTPEQQNADAVAKIIELFGSRAKVAAYLGLTRQSVATWRAVPHHYVRRLSEKTGLPFEEIRPNPYH